MTDHKLADEIERALNVLQPLAHGDILFSAPNAGCDLRFSTLREAIASLRRQPSSDKVLVPRSRYKELLDCLEAVASGKGGWAWEDVLEEHRAMLSAAEAEGRKT